MSGTFYGCYLLRPVILRRLIWATPASKMQLDEFSIVPQNTHQPAHPFRYLVLVFKIFLTRLEAQHLDTWLHACSPTSHAATDSMLAQSTTRTVAGTRCCGRASTSCASTARTRFHVVQKITALRLSDLAHRPTPLRVALVRVLQRGSTK